jgi:hypothetical protein
MSTEPTQHRTTEDERLPHRLGYTQELFRAIVWVAIITCLFSVPLYSAGVPWADGFTWELTNYTVLWFAGIGLIFGGWRFLSAKNWFKGPVRMGTEEELERLEAEQERAFPLPADTTYGSR